MKNIISTLILILGLSLFSAQSVIIEAEGTASMGDTKSRRDTMNEARTNALRQAAENAGTHISSETTIRDFVTEKDLIEAFAGAVTKVVQEISDEWFNDERMGESYRVTLQVEVTPKEMKAKPDRREMIDSPTAPLTVKLWTANDKAEFKSGEKISLYMKGNKPYFAKVVYVQADGTQVQILPNQFRKDNYFEGGTVYTLPSGKDQYDLTVSEPFGEEKIIVYASTSELGDVKLEDAGSVFVIGEKAEDTGVRTRGIKITKRDDTSKPKAAEFHENSIKVKTYK